MDKLYNNPWFLKAVAFLIAVMLFTMVTYDNVNNQPGGLTTITEGSYTIEEVPLNVLYEEEYVITEMVEHVQVNLKGPQTFLNIFKLERPSYELYIDLRNLKVGTHSVIVQYKGFPNELTAINIAPREVLVTIEEKKTISLPIEIDLINKAEIEEGYTIGTPIVNPVNVEITAAESIINQVAFAKGFVDIKNMKKTTEMSVPIKVFDQRGNELLIDVNPTVVDVKIPFTSPNKEVPLKIKRVGALPEGLSIRTIYTDPKDVTVYAPVDVIDKISLIEGIEIDLTKITENTIIEVKVPVPDGVEEISPATVKVVIEVDIEEAVEFEDITVEIIGLSDRMDLSFVEPKEVAVALTAMGSPNAIERLKKEEIKVYIDVNQLSIGEHTVPVQISGPQNITFKINYEEILVLISEALSTKAVEGNT